MKGKALRRALQTADVGRLGVEAPHIVDTTELISPDTAYDMLSKNTNNRPINWRKVEEYAKTMAEGKWALHAQGIILDTHGNILTGQKRLWAVIYSNVSVYMRVSRGNPPEVASLLDRGDPQTSRDLASRRTGRKHSPVESSLARGVLALQGVLRPSQDAIADAIEVHDASMQELLKLTKGMKKPKAVLMIMAAMCVHGAHRLQQLAPHIEGLAERLNGRLMPESADSCWGKGSAFTLAMGHASELVKPGRP